MTLQPQRVLPTAPSTATANPTLGTDATAGSITPRQIDTFASSGGTAGVNDHSGGGGNTLASCMGFWQPQTHMTRGEWRDTCQRTLNGIDLPPEEMGPGTSRIATQGPPVSDEIPMTSTSSATTTSAPAPRHHRATHHRRTRQPVESMSR